MGEVIINFVIGLVIGGVIGYFIGRRGKQELQNAKDELNTIRSRMSAEMNKALSQLPKT